MTNELFKKNLLQLYDRCSDLVIEEGKIWYKQANMFAENLSNKYNLLIIVLVLFVSRFLVWF